MPPTGKSPSTRKPDVKVSSCGNQRRCDAATTSFASMQSVRSLFQFAESGLLRHPDLARGRAAFRRASTSSS
eukprot:scaffold18951_cov63-Phaeocystis_antarctica.AAC.13